MKLYQKVLWLACFLGVLGWASSVMAAPIPYSFTWYTAHAETGGGRVYEQNYPLPEVFADSIDFYPLMPNQAHAQALEESSFSVFSIAHSGIANSFVHETFKFTSTFPAIKIQYDFNISASAGIEVIGSPFETSSGKGAINSFLMDTTTGQTIWRDDQIVTASAFGTVPPFAGGGNKSGSTDEILALTLGHEYELFLSCSSEAEGAPTFFINNGFGSAELTNIQVDAVPIPSSLLLLSTGLIGLWKFRKRLAG